MATYEEHVDKLMTCPYDDTHKVKESRFQLHVSKCEKNNLDHPCQTCPFNAKHKTPVGELAHHIMICTCRVAVDRQLTAAASTNDSYGGHVGVPSYHSEHTLNMTDENWDDETLHIAPGYVPNEEPPNGGIRTEFPGMKKSARNQYYASLHHKNAEWDGSQERTATSPSEMRKPKTKSLAQMTSEKPVHEYQNIGLGRGQPILPSPKIAANIFGQHPAAMRQPRSTKHTPGFESPNLGMGRGNNVVFVNGDDDQDDTDFILVGRGRGKRRH